MLREIKDRLKGRKKVKDGSAASHAYRMIEDYFSGTGERYYYHAWCPDQSYHHSLSNFLEVLKKGDEKMNSVTWRETLGWEPLVKFSWDKPQSFPPQEAAEYIKRRNLLSDNWNYFESRWQIFSSRYQEQNYFDIKIYHCNFPMGSREVGRLKKKITIDYLLRREVEGDPH